MIYPYRPPVDATTREQIEEQLHVIDRNYWSRIRKMRVETFIPPAEPIPPQLPQQLLKLLREYVRTLFTTEADEYRSFRAEQRFPFWLNRIADRVVLRVQNAYEKIDRADDKLILGYHGIQHSWLIGALREETGDLVYKHTQSMPASTTDVGPKAETGEVAEQESMAEQLKRLQEECGVTAEEMAEAIDVGTRSIYRHLAGDAIPRRTHIAAYERLFSKRLGRNVTLKRQ